MDPFGVLGLPRRYDIESAELEARYRELQRALHPDRHMGGSASERRLALLKATEVNEAYRTMKDDLRRGEALLVSYGGRAGEGAQDPEFLVEVMELREALSSAKAERNSVQIDALAEQVSRSRRQTQADLRATFEELAAGPAPAALAKAAALLGRLKYFARFLDEVAAIREEALG
jgi:molecular chaperone HscB